MRDLLEDTIIASKTMQNHYKVVPPMIRLRIFVLSVVNIFCLSHFGQIVVPANGCVTDNFDASNTWTFGGSNSSWTYGNPNKLQITDDITGGGNCIILGGNTPSSTYNSNEDSWAQSPVYDFSLITDPYLEFYFYWSNEGSTSYDEIWMEYSTNGGSNWQIVSPPAGTGGCYDQNWYNYPDNWGGNVGGCFSGSGGPTNWVTVRKCISSLGGLPQVSFRLRISTGTQCNNFGATLDNWTICDASINAFGNAQCTGNPREFNFTEWSYPCPDQWHWDFGDGTSSNLQYPTHAYSTAGSYNVILTATSSSAMTSGCGIHSDQYTFTVNAEDAPSLSYSSSGLCINDNPISPNLSGSSQGTFSASPSGLSINANTGVITPSGSVSGNYTITFTPTSFCIPSASTTINILESPSIIPPLDITACHGDLISPIPLNTQPSGLNAQWNVISGQDIGFGISGNGSIPSFTATNSAGAPYTEYIELLPISNNGCSAIPDTFAITIGNLPNSNFTANPDIGCAPLESNFTAASSASSCSWNFGDGTSSNQCNSVSHTFQNGTYDIAYTTTSALGCTSTTTHPQLIQVLPSAESYFSYSPLLISTDNSVINLQSEAINADSMIWEISGNNGFFFSSTEEILSLELPKDTATYLICLSTFNASNCNDILCEQIVVLNTLSFFIPNTFTPNGDGVNDFFGPVFSGIEPTQYHLQIFNRWGQLIFESKQISEQWNGLYLGSKAATDAYVWRLKYQEQNTPEFKEARGHVNLIR